MTGRTRYGIAAAVFLTTWYARDWAGWAHGPRRYSGWAVAIDTALLGGAIFSFIRYLRFGGRDD